MFPSKAVQANFEGLPSKLDDNNLACNYYEPDHNEDLVLHNATEDIELVVYLSSINHVENLHHNKYIKGIGVMSTWSKLSLLCDVKWSVIPIIKSSGI